MRRELAAVLLCSGLGACVTPPAAAPPLAATAHRHTLETARLACNRKYPPQVGNFALHAKCVNAAVDRYALPGARYPDLLRLQEQVRSRLSSQIDGGAISREDGAQRMDEADKAIGEAERERSAARPDAAADQVARVQAMLKE